MSAFVITSAASPILCSALAILIFRKSALTGALLGILVAAVVIFSSSTFTIDMAGVRTVAATTLILTLSAAFVIVPGLYLNAVLRTQGVIDGLAERIASLRLDREHKALLLLLGFLPAVESLTGFGVSLFLSVPIFFRLFAPARAYRLSLLGMNIMPWGTLALATVVGASLSGNSVPALGAMTALTSALVFPCVGLIALVVVGQGAMLKKHGGMAVTLGAGLSASLYLFNKLGFTEVAGIMAGATTTCIGFFLMRTSARRNIDLSPKDGAATAAPLIRLLLPYILVLSLLALTRMVSPLYRWLSDLWILSSGKINFSVFGSPGVTLALAVALLLISRPVRIDHKTLWKRAHTAVFSLCCFIFLAQLMSESHMVTAIATALREWGNQENILVVASPLLGMASGFITGSNLGGNALVMNVQTQIGAISGHGLLFSALQNSAAGHAVFTSLPIIILVMTIARDTVSMDGKAKTIEHDLLRFGLKAASFIYAALVLAFAVLQRYST